MGCRVSGFRVWDLGFRVSGCKIHSTLEVRVSILESGHVTTTSLDHTPNELESKLLKGVIQGGYIGDYKRGYEGEYWEFRLWLQWWFLQNQLHDLELLQQGQFGYGFPTTFPS